MNRQHIEDYLLCDGIQPNLVGFAYLVEAIGQYAVGTKIVRELYPSVASVFNTAPNRVERGIRHAISKSKTHAERKNAEYIALAKLMIGRKDG